jgi:SAM-dependent methyltransferase
VLVGRRVYARALSQAPVRSAFVALAHIREWELPADRLPAVQRYWAAVLRHEHFPLRQAEELIAVHEATIDGFVSRQLDTSRQAEDELVAMINNAVAEPDGRTLVVVTVISARNLYQTDTFGRDDPYVVVTIGEPRQTKMTKTIEDGGGNCTWGHGSSSSSDEEELCAHSGLFVPFLSCSMIVLFCDSTRWHNIVRSHRVTPEHKLRAQEKAKARKDCRRKRRAQPGFDEHGEKQEKRGQRLEFVIESAWGVLPLGLRVMDADSGGADDDDEIGGGKLEVGTGGQLAGWGTDRWVKLIRLPPTETPRPPLLELPEDATFADKTRHMAQELKHKAEAAVKRSQGWEWVPGHMAVSINPEKDILNAHAAGKWEDLRLDGGGKLHIRVECNSMKIIEADSDGEEELGPDSMQDIIHDNELEPEEVRIVQRYFDKVRALKANNAAQIKALAKIAKSKEGRELYSPLVRATELAVREAQPSAVLIKWYLVDAICKEVGGVFVEEFACKIVRMFGESFARYDISAQVREKLSKVLHTWGVSRVFKPDIIHGLKAKEHVVLKPDEEPLEPFHQRAPSPTHLEGDSRARALWSVVRDSVDLPPKLLSVLLSPEYEQYKSDMKMGAHEATTAEISSDISSGGSWKMGASWSPLSLRAMRPETIMELEDDIEVELERGPENDEPEAEPELRPDELIRHNLERHVGTVERAEMACRIIASRPDYLEQLGRLTLLPSAHITGWGWDAREYVNALHDRSALTAVEQLPLRPAPSVLMIGCGTPAAVYALATRLRSSKAGDRPRGRFRGSIAVTDPSLRALRATARRLQPLLEQESESGTTVTMVLTGENPTRPEHPGGRALHPDETMPMDPDVYDMTYRELQELALGMMSEPRYHVIRNQELTATAMELQQAIMRARRDATWGVGAKAHSHLPFRAASFDHVLVHPSGRHLQPWALSELQRLLRPGGVLVVPSRRWPTEIEPLKSVSPFGTPENLVRHATVNGFVRARVELVDKTPPQDSEEAEYSIGELKDPASPARGRSPTGFPTTSPTRSKSPTSPNARKSFSRSPKKVRKRSSPQRKNNSRHNCTSTPGDEVVALHDQTLAPVQVKDEDILQLPIELSFAELHLPLYADSAVKLVGQDIPTTDVQLGADGSCIITGDNRVQVRAQRPVSGRDPDAPAKHQVLADKQAVAAAAEAVMQQADADSAVAAAAAKAAAERQGAAAEGAEAATAVADAALTTVEKTAADDIVDEKYQELASAAKVAGVAEGARLKAAASAAEQRKEAMVAAQTAAVALGNVYQTQTLYYEVTVEQCGHLWIGWAADGVILGSAESSRDILQEQKQADSDFETLVQKIAKMKLPMLAKECKERKLTADFEKTQKTADAAQQNLIGKIGEMRKTQLAVALMERGLQLEEKAPQQELKEMLLQTVFLEKKAADRDRLQQAIAYLLEAVQVEKATADSKRTKFLQQPYDWSPFHFIRNTEYANIYGAWVKGDVISAAMWRKEAGLIEIEYWRNGVSLLQMRQDDLVENPLGPLFPVISVWRGQDIVKATMFRVNFGRHGSFAFPPDCVSVLPWPRDGATRWRADTPLPPPRLPTPEKIVKKKVGGEKKKRSKSPKKKGSKSPSKKAAPKKDRKKKEVPKKGSKPKKKKK